MSFAVNAPSTPVLGAGQDTGASNTDNITSVNVPTFTGTALPGGTVTLYDGATAIGTAVVAGNGTYTVAASQALADGQHQIGVTVGDGLGHVSAESTLTTLTIDTMAPTAPGAPTLLNDTGASFTDGITSNASIVYATPVGSDVLLYKVNTGAYSTTAPSFTTDGTYTVSTEERDLAGNVSAASSLTFTLDTTAPTAPVAPTLAADTGVAGDNITSNATINYATPVGSDVLLYKVGAGVYSTTAPSFTTDGTYTVSTEERDLAGNVSGASSLTFTLDTTAPAAPAAPVLVSDTGTWTTDNVTSNAAITYATPVGSDVLLYKVGNGAYSTTAPSITADGTYTVSTEERDLAGNVSAASSLTFTLDTTAPAAPAAPTLAADTGVAGDNITSNASIVYATPVDSDVLLYKVGTGAYSTTAPSFTADGTYTVSTEERDLAGNVSGASSLTFTLDTTAPTAPGAPTLAVDTGVVGDNITNNATINYATPVGSDVLLYKVGTGAYSTTAPSFTADGTYTVSTEERDLAGNVSGASSLTFTLDTTAPTTPVAPTLAVDTGAAGDNITSNATITYATPVGSDVLLYKVGTGAYSTTAPSFSADGTYTVSTEERDLAGNVSAASSLTFTLDTTAPATPAAPVLTDDTSGGSKVTSDPAIAYAAPASGDTLLYQVDNTGAFTTTRPTFLTDGTQDGVHTVSVEEQDAAGNTSGASSLTFTLDTGGGGGPAIPTAPVLANDTSGGQNVTSDPTITYAAPASGDTLYYKVGSSGTYSTVAPTFATDGTQDGTYTVFVEQRTAANVASAASTLTFTLDTQAPGAPGVPVLTHDTSGGMGVTSDPSITYVTPATGDTLVYNLDNGGYTTTRPTVTGDGTHTVSIEERDAAGNTSTASSLTFTLDTATPAALAAPVLAHDTSGGQNITSDPTITYAAATSGDTILYRVDGATTYTTVQPTFATNGTQDGTHTVSVEQKDAAGNVSAASSLTFTLDTMTPATVTTPVLAHDTSGGLGITSDPTITYAAAASGDTLYYKVDTGAYTTTLPTFATNGTQDGAHTVSVEERDAAGNSSAASSLTFTLDTQAPAALAAPVLAHDTSGGQNITNDPSITYATAASGDTVLYRVDGATTYTTVQPVFATNGTQDGTHTVSVEQKDAAGNVSAASSLTFTLDTVTPATLATPTLVHDTSGGQSITSDPTIAYAAAATGDTLYYKVDTGAYTTALPTFATNGMQDGAHTVSVEERDAAGNSSAASSLTFTLDTQAPAAPTAPVLADDTSGGQGVTRDPAITYATAAPGDTLLYRVDGATTYTTTVPTFATNGTQDGPHTVSVEEKDAAGNISTASSLSFTLDTITPVVTASGPGGAYHSNIGPTVVNASVDVTDTSGSALQSAMVVIATGLQAGDILAANTTGTSISASYSANTGTLTLTGTDTAADYQQVLRSVTYTSTSSNPTVGGTDVTRTIAFSASAGPSNTSAPVNTAITVDQAPLAPPAAPAQGMVPGLVYTGTAGTSGTGALRGDSDPEGGTLSITQVNGSAGNVGVSTAGAYGHLTLNADGSETYLGDRGLAIVSAVDGSPITDTFTYVVTDSEGSATASTDTFTVSLVAGGIEAVANLSDVAAPARVLNLGATRMNVTETVAGTYSGVIQNGTSGNVGGVLSVAGPAALTLTGHNTYTGRTSVGGTLDLAAGGSIATSQALKMLSGGVFDISGETSGASVIKVKGPGGTIKLGSQTLTLSGSTMGEFDGTITDGGVAGGTGGVLKVLGTGGVLLTGVSTYTGKTSVAATLELGAGGAIASSQALKMIAGGVFDISAETAGASVIKVKGVGGTIKLGSQTLTLSGSNMGEFDGTITDGGLAGGAGGVLKVLGTGGLTLTGVNSYTGKTSVAATLALSGDGSIASSQALKMIAGGVFDISAETTGASVVKVKGPGGTIELGSKTLTLSGSTMGEFDGTITDGGVAGGTGGVLKVLGAGGVLLTGINSYTGRTSVGATLELGTGASIATSQALKMLPGGVFDISGDTGGATIKKLKGTGGTVELGAQTLTVTGSTAGEFDGTITDGGIAGGAGGVLNLVGPGALLLTGTSTYTGGTIVGSGSTLELDGAGAAGSGTITFNGAGTVKLDAPALTAVSGTQSSFGNTIAGMGVGDALDLASLAFSSGSTTATISNGVLTATSGGNSVTLNLTGVADGTQFTAAADATGGTVITQTPVIPGAFVYTPASAPGSSQAVTPSGDLAPSPATMLADALNAPSNSASSTFTAPASQGSAASLATPAHA
ncbi:Ig-like domain-containing protein [Beijerinckia sp. L45]|uniref:Ig-like domain-containing protein n=1 Tax=Beijerinckia sp. L45 TaxID=1641855 RepID=UPI001AED8940|nr:Ig-like domain-containing protein [Beijerinckia sp. L45]